MRIGLLLTALALMVSVLAAQERQDPYSLAAVRASLSDRSRGIGVGPVESQILRLGDGCAIALLKILKPRDLTDPQMIKNFLPMLRDSFSYPKIIQMQDNKTPNVTLFLLGYLYEKVREESVRVEISSTIEFIQKQTAPEVSSPGK